MPANQEWEVHGTVVEVTDGDTIKLDLDLGWLVVLRNEPIRVYGINAPEKNTPEGKAAKEFAQKLLPVGTKVRILSREWLGEREKYGRVLASIYLGDKSFTAEMLAAGHAKEYYGGKR